jgi:DnaJ-class molecular chaperone
MAQETCPQCKGSGSVVFIDSKGNKVIQTCPTCYGRGTVTTPRSLIYDKINGIERREQA